MRPILIVIIAGAGVAVLAAARSWGSPLFIDRIVSEAFPVELPGADEMDDMPFHLAFATVALSAR